MPHWRASRPGCGVTVPQRWRSLFWSRGAASGGRERWPAAVACQALRKQPRKAEGWSSRQLQVRYYSNGHACSLDVLSGTITSQDSYGLVQLPASTPAGALPPVEECGFRMLDPEEVELGMGFWPTYTILGTTEAERVAQCGRAVRSPRIPETERLCWQLLLRGGTSLSTIICSPLPAEPTSPEVAKQAGLAAIGVGRERYPPLPWLLEELVGTAWRNPYTGSLKWVARLECSHEKQKPRPYFATRLDWRIWGDSPGLWWGKIFVIEHWVRVDHWPPAEQMLWFGTELRCHRESIAHLEQQLAEIVAHPERACCPVENTTMFQQDLAAHRKALGHVLERLRRFATEHHLAS